MQVAFSTLSGAAFAPAITLSGRRRSLASVVREAADWSRPFVVAVIRRAEILKRSLSPAALGALVMRPPQAMHRLQAEWGRTRVSGADIVTITYLPGGGGSAGGSGGSSQRKSGVAIGASIAAIALAVIAPYAIPFIAGGLGVAAGTIGYAALTVAYAGVVVGLNYLAARAGRAKANKEAESRPLYGVSGGGNLARPGERIPVGYGRYWTVPALSQPDYIVNDGADQTLYKRMTIGCGKYAIKTIRVGTAIIWQDGVIPASLSAALSVEHIQPGAVSSLVPGQVTSSPDVTGLELPRPDSLTPWAGPFRASPQGTAIKRIQIDYGSDAIYANGPTGSKFANTQYAAGAAAVFEYAPADINGNPAGPWVAVPSTTLFGSSRQAVRRTIYVDVTEGEYLVRARNASAVLVWGGENGAYWTGLRGHVGDTTTRPGITELAMRIKAGPGVPITAYSNIEVEVARILPCRRSGAFVEMESRKALDAAFDMARNTDYGMAVADAKIDWAKVESYIAGVTQYDTFDGQINGPVSGWEAMAALLGPMRAEPRQFGDLLTFIRDEPSTVRRHHFTRRQILSGSTTQSTRVDRQDGASHLLNEYFVGGDPKRRQEALATYGPAPVARTRGALEGVTEHAHAVHLTRWAAASSFYRSRTAEFDVELNHRLVLPGDACGVDVWFLTDALAAGVEARAGDVLTIDCDLAWPASPPASPYLVLLDSQGREFGPIACTIAGRAVTLNAADRAAAEAAAGISLATALGADIDSIPAPCRIGALDEVTEGWIVQAVRPKTWSTATITCVNDSAEVWTAIGAAMPPAPAVPSVMADPPIPVLDFVRGGISQDGAALTLNWQAHRARGALRFEVECSLDGSATFVPVSFSEQAQGQFSLPALDAAVTAVALRARGYGAPGFPGPWVYGSTPARDVSLLVAPQDMAVELAAPLQAMQQQINELRARINANAGADIDSIAFGEIKALDLRRDLGAAEASIQQTATALATTDAALAQLETDLSAAFNGDTAQAGLVLQALARGDLVGARQLLSVSATAGLLASYGQLEIQSATDGTNADALIKLLVRAGQTGALTEAGLVIRAVAGGGQTAGHVTIKGDRVTFEPSNPTGGRIEISLAGAAPRIQVFNGSNVEVVRLGAL